MPSSKLNREYTHWGDDFGVFDDGAGGQRTPGFTLCDDKGQFLATSVAAQIALGNVTGYAGSTKFGRVRDIDAADDARDIWCFADDDLSTRASTKTFPSAADTIYITSSSTSDTAVTVNVDYIDSTGASATATGVTVTGQTPVSIGATGLDVNRFYVTSATAAVGTLYASVGNDFTTGLPNDVTDILAVILPGYGQTQQGQFTVPLAKTLVMGDVLVNVSRASGAAGSADITLRVKPYGQSSRIKREYFLTDSAPLQSGVKNLVVPARAQIVWRVDDVSDLDTNVSVNWEYLLIDD